MAWVEIICINLLKVSVIYLKTIVPPIHCLRFILLRLTHIV